MKQSKKEYVVPTLLDLHKNPEQAFEDDQFNYILNQPPHETWVKQHPIAKVKNDAGNEVPAKYLPIDKVEFMLTRIFQRWRVEILSCGVMFNSCYCVIRLHVYSPLSDTWTFHDGVGAKSVQVDKGSSAADLGSIKDAAVMMALPSAKTYAIKDAADHLGKLFGRDLNRRDTIKFAGAYTPKDEEEDTKTPAQPNPVTSPGAEDIPFETVVKNAVDKGKNEEPFDSNFEEEDDLPM